MNIVQNEMLINLLFLELAYEPKWGYNGIWRNRSRRCFPRWDQKPPFQNSRGKILILKCQVIELCEEQTL